LGVDFHVVADMGDQELEWRRLEGVINGEPGLSPAWWPAFFLMPLSQLLPWQADLILLSLLGELSSGATVIRVQVHALPSTLILP
jgi:hypothetical protein